MFPMTNYGADNLRLSRIGDTLVLKWRADSLSAWLLLGAALIVFAIARAANLPGSGAIALFAIFAFFVVATPAPPQIWRRNLTTTFDLSTRQVRRSPMFRRRSPHYSFDEIAGLGAIKQDDEEAGSTYCEIVMRLKSGPNITLGYTSLDHYRSAIGIADKIVELIGL
jgi:hypothetical protein